MNHYTYKEIEIGQTESFSVKVTQKMMENFYDITGDYNPMHIDDQVVYGMLTASFMSTLAGVYLPGEHSLIHKVEVEFPAPLYVGTHINITGKVVRKDDNYNTIVVKVIILTNDGKKVCRGKLRIGVLE